MKADNIISPQGHITEDWTVAGESSPWRADSYGVVPLLAMLDFAAEKYWELSGLVMKFSLLPMLASQIEATTDFNAKLVEAYKDCHKLGLKLSANQLRLIFDTLNSGRFCSAKSYSAMVEQLGRRIHEELNEVWFRIIPFEKHDVCSPMWLVDSPIFSPEYEPAFKEFQHAGMCYGISENAACVFHLMRIVDFGIRKVANSLDVPYDAHNWHGIGEFIRKKMEEKYTTKSDDWKFKEPFYAEILTDIQAIGRGHRNPHLHEIASTYDDKEARYMLTVVEGFIRHLAEKLEMTQ